MDAFEILQAQISDLKSQLAKQPRFKRGQIVSTSPLRVKWDGSDPLDGEPDSFVPISSLSVGDYVDLRLDGTRAVIIGSTGGDTGWLPVEGRGGFVSAAFVRRVGGVLYFRGTLTGSLPAGVTTTVGHTGSTDLAPTAGNFAAQTTTSSAASVDYVVITSVGGIAIRNSAAITGSFYVSPLSGAQTD